MDFHDQKNESADFASEVDSLEANSRHHEALRRQADERRIAAALASIQAREAAFDPAAQAAIHERRRYRPRQKREGLGARLTAIQEHLLRALAFLNDMGIVSITVPELANRIGCSTRSIQYGLAYLVEIGYIRRDVRPGANPRRHLPSHIRLLSPGWLRLGRLAPADIGTQKIALPSEDKNNNSCTKAERSGADAPREGARATPTAAARQPSLPAKPDAAESHQLPSGRQREAAKPAHARPTIAHESTLDRPLKPTGLNSLALARAAASRLHPSRAPIIEKLDPFDVLDAVRRQHFSHFDQLAWHRALDAHGRETALLAVALALLRPSDGRGRVIKSKASYLGGMLRQSRGALNPVASLSSLLN